MWVFIIKKGQTLERNSGQTSHCDDADDGLKRKSGKKQFSTYNVDCMYVRTYVVSNKG